MLPGRTYHFYNHANGWENLFNEERNYPFFLGKLREYILPIAKLYAYCLLPDHFHLTGSIRSEEELLEVFRIPDQFAQRPERLPIFLKQKISKAFSNCLNSYAQSFNKVYSREGSLFMQNLRKDEITDEKTLRKQIHYIHANPIHHGFANKIEEWPHSSYQLLLGKADTFLEREYVLKLFGGVEQFLEYHKQAVDLNLRTFD